MSAYSVVQALIIAAVVVWSAWFAARRLLPTVSRRAQASIATWLERPSHRALLRRWGRALQPVQAASGGCGSSGCSSCGACAAPAQHETEARPLLFQSRSK